MTMTRTRLALLFVLGAVGCSSRIPAVVDAGPEGAACLTDRDCPDPAHPNPLLFMCNKVSGRCEPGCINREHCSAEVRGGAAIEACRTDQGGLGCECDEGRCVPRLCSSDQECGGERRCRDGACVAATLIEVPARCQVVPDLTVLRRGAAASFTVLAWGARGVPVVPAQGAQWASVTGGPLSGAGTGLEAALTAERETPADGTPVVAVEAAVGTARCQARAVVLPQAPEADEVLVVLADELSGRPVGGATVVMTKEDGAPVPSNGLARTDGRGLARLALPGQLSRYVVTAYSAEHTYVTVAGLESSARYVWMLTRRHQSDRYGGVRGSYAGAPASANAQLGVAGLSLGGSFTGLSLGQLMGPPVPRDITLGELSQKGVPIPAGVSLAIAGTPVKTSYAAQGLAGVCVDDSGAPDEAAIASGSCGTWAAWSFSGDVPLALLPFDRLLGGGRLDDLDAAELFPKLGAIVSTMSSSVQRDVRIALAPPPRSDGGVADLSNQDRFAQVDHPFVQVPLAFPFVIQLPELPKYRGAYVGSVMAIGAAAAPGRGLVPLGMGAAVNADESAQVDAQAPLRPGQLLVRMAPTHHGLEGAEYLVLIGALGGSGGDAAQTPGTSFLVARPAGHRLTFDPEGRAPWNLSQRTFLPLPEGARFNFLDVEASGLPPRSFRFVEGPDLSTASVVRVTLADVFDHRWEILMAPTAVGFTLPKPPAGYADRAFALDDSTGPRSSMMVHTQRFESNEGALRTFAQVLELDEARSDRLGASLTALALVDYTRPTIEFLEPSGTLPRGGTLSAKVWRFQLGRGVGANGVVRLSFTPEAGCPPAVLSEETTPGNGIVQLALPPGCVGTDLTVTAALLEQDGVTPVRPPVSATRRLTIE